MRIVMVTAEENEYATKELEWDIGGELDEVLDKMAVHNMIGEMIMETNNIKAIRIEHEGEVLRTAHVTIHDQNKA